MDEDKGRAPGSAPKLVSEILENGKVAFDPSLDEAQRKEALITYNEIIERSAVLALIPALNALIKPNTLDPWLREAFLQTLTRLPLRKHGVRASLEFVFSVHPSNVGRTPDSSEPQKQGANITHEAVAVATKLLSSVPTGMTADDWFQGIAPQLFALIDGEAGPELSKTAAQVVGFGILGKKQYGAPGSPGWNAFVQPLVADINPSLKRSTEPKIKKEADEDELIDLSRNRQLIQSRSLKRSLHRLKTIILSNPAPGLCGRLLHPVLLQTWVLSAWEPQTDSLADGICKPARSLWRAYLRLFGKFERLQLILNNIHSKGPALNATYQWKYSLTTENELEIVPVTLMDTQEELDWSGIESKAATFVEDLVDMCATPEVSSMFLHLLQSWIQSSDANRLPKVAIKQEAADPRNAIIQLVHVTILQKLMEKAPEKLIDRFDNLLDLVCQVLVTDERSGLEDEIMAVVLSLLNLIIGAPTFRKSDMPKEKLQIVEDSLTRLSQQDRASIAPTARNLQMLLTYKGDFDKMEDGDEATTAPNPHAFEDRRTYDLAMEYITGSESPPPVVTEGINLLSGLVASGSSVLDVNSILVLMSNLLASDEDYINLRVIKLFTQLAGKHPRSTTNEILDHYLDSPERISTDVRLRFGEALLQVIERLGTTFTGEIAQKVGETLLSIAGRRGYRPKTLAKQQRDQRLAELKAKKNKGEDVDVDMDAIMREAMPEEDRVNEDIMAQIVQGWESKRGSEDVRMRSSALSIFGNTMETNIAGLGATLASASVDLCINVLTLEPEMEKAILRRAAIIVIMSFVRALDSAKQAGRSLGFGLTEESRKDIVISLQYIAGTDNDGLVRQHAEDTVESLENWSMSTMLPAEEHLAPNGLTRLAGLSVNPETSIDTGSQGLRPRIEEIE